MDVDAFRANLRAAKEAALAQRTEKIMEKAEEKRRIQRERYRSKKDAERKEMASTSSAVDQEDTETQLLPAERKRVTTAPDRQSTNKNSEKERSAKKAKQQSSATAAPRNDRKRRAKSKQSLVVKKTSDKQRQKEREKKRRQREKLKADPLKWEAQKEKWKSEYEARKARKRKEMEKKPVSDRKKRAQQKKWRINTKAYRQRKRAAQDAEVFAEINSPPESPAVQIVEERSHESPLRVEDETPGTANDKQSTPRPPRKRNTPTNLKLRKALLEQKKELEAAHRKIRMYKKRLQRMEKKRAAVGTPSPRTKLRNMVGRYHLPQAVVKELVFTEAVVQQVKTKSKIIGKTEQGKQALSVILSGRLLKKYRMLKQASGLLSYHHNQKFIKKEDIKFARKPTYYTKYKVSKQRIEEFLEEDIHSRMCPGVKDKKSRGNVVKQKRVLLNSLRNLHKQFCASSGKNISYTTFCRLRPFWIVPPTARETCLCVKHENVQLIIDKLRSYNVLPVVRGEDIGKVLCCDVNSKCCMYRECSKCKHLEISIGDLTEEDKLREVEYFQYKSGGQQHEIKGKLARVKVTEKTMELCTLQELTEKLNVLLPPYLVHVYNIRNQYTTIKSLKCNLKENEMAVQIDFSENYYLKHHRETQAMHFGASKKQITLHTGVAHFKPQCSEESSVESQAFCSVSNSLDHGARAVWTHLKPYLKYVAEKFPLIDTLHFISDGPSAQYKNKFNLYLLTELLPLFLPNISKATWNFTEPGHGKGAADGVGGVLKRTADRLVLQEHDLSDVATFYKLLKEACPGVELFDVSNDETVSECLPDDIGPSIPGTMKIRQITWELGHLREIGLRYLSCFQCGWGKCAHYQLQPNSWTFKHKSSNTTNTYKVDDWVVVQYEGEWFPGIVQEIYVRNGITRYKISCLEANGLFFRYPVKKDVAEYEIDSILRKIAPLKLVSASRKQYQMDDAVRKSLDMHG